jgi:hypothetical protein
MKVLGSMGSETYGSKVFMESYVRFEPMGLGPHWPQDFIDTILNPHDLSVFYTKYHYTDIIGSEGYIHVM